MINLMIFIIVILQFILIVQFSIMMTYIKSTRLSMDFRLDNLTHRIENLEGRLERYINEKE